MSNTNYVQRVQDPFALKTGSGVQQVQAWVISCEFYLLKQGRDFALLFVNIFCCMLDHKEPLVNPLSFLARFEVPRCSWVFVSRLSCEFTRKLWFTEPLSGTVRLPTAACQWQRIHAEEWNSTMKNSSEVPRSSTGLQGAWPGAVEQVGVSLLGDELIWCVISVTCDSRAPTFLVEQRTVTSQRWGPAGGNPSFWLQYSGFYSCAEIRGNAHFGKVSSKEKGKRSKLWFA